MPISIPGSNTWHANVTGPAPLDSAEGTEIGATMGTQLQDNIRVLATMLGGSYLIVDADIQTITDGGSAYGTNATQTGTTFSLMSLQANITAEEDDIIVAFAQVTGHYTGANFGEFRLEDKGINAEGSHARLEQDAVNVGAFVSYFRVLGVGEDGGRTIDLEGRVSVSGTLTLKGSCQLIALVLRPQAVLP